ncbi:MULTISPECIES: SulP family inorganic anion transporter [Hungatella]|mgnify:FL=1|uniref:STAS domain-containing protein n=1 Tax=Hungatella hathewayi TaxID=154046 RepID=A0AAW9WE58_9FIRM|nr:MULTISPECIES: SulP family inorganic anion transporter [Hungatella]MCQ4828255.1 SulP family inorganic anion transporter [Hungatella sp. SL.1.14]MUB63056.1 STAS domain-containing protein [Hungatella hathewayi]CUP36901.1 sulfate transporter [Hungatella hathewayi]
MIKNYVTQLKSEFRNYSGADCMKDLMAGLTVAAVALPLALAFGVSSGSTAAAGLVTAIIAGLVIGTLSGGYYQISGPTGAMAAILISIIARYGMQGVFTATLIAGILLVLCGIFHIGRLTGFIPAPVITGFTSGIAVIIALGQIDNFFGVTSEGSSAILKLLSYGQLGFPVNIQAAALGLFVVLFMVFFPKKWNAVVPASFLSIIFATVLSVILNLDIQTVGAIPKTLFLDTRLDLSAITPDHLSGLIGPAVSIAMLGMIESLLCGASAGKMANVRLNSDQELVAQGIGNIILPFFGGIPATAAIARTSVALKSGARTRLTGIFHALGLLAFMFILGPVMAKIPLSALAGVLMVTAFRMNDWQEIRYIFSHHFKGAAAKYLITMAATIVFDLTTAILIGVVTALVLLVSRLANIEINYEKVNMDRVRSSDAALAKEFGNAVVAYLTGSVIFANTQAIEEMETCTKEYDTVLLSMRGVSYMDISGAIAFMHVLSDLQAEGKRILLCGVPTSTMAMLKRSDIYDMIGEENFYWSVEKAILHK